MLHGSGESDFEGEIVSWRRTPDHEKQPIVVLSESQTTVLIDLQTEVSALTAAFNVTMSPHEWDWSKEQQVDMARYVLWAHQRLSAISQLTRVNDLKHGRIH